MKLKRLAAAAVALASSGPGQALTPAEIDAARTAGTLKEIRLVGSSSLRLSIAAYMKLLCRDSYPYIYGNDLHVYFDANSNGNDHRAYACTLAVSTGYYPAGTPLLVYKRDLGGSGQGVAPIATGALQQHQIITAASCSITVDESASDDPAAANYMCTRLSSTTAGDPTAVRSDAGISDVEVAMMNASVNTGAPLTYGQINFLNSGLLVQALFGVAVNKKTYRALQEAQGIISVGGAMLDVPADQEAWSPATLATIPSLPRQFIVSALTQLISGGVANARGWNRVIPNSAYSLDGGATTRPAVDVNSVKKTINVCRRARGSGTQAASNLYFLQNPCNAATGAYPPSGAVLVNATGLTATVEGGSVFQSGASTGEVESCLGTDVESAASPGTDGVAYGLGVLSRENNPRRSGGDLGYRFVKIDGHAPVRNEARAGRYGFVYEATMQWNPDTLAGQSEKLAFLTSFRNDFGKPGSLSARATDTLQGVMSSPSTYGGSYSSPNSYDAGLFGSSVARTGNLSCSPLRIVK